jgi:hypothetical protein
VTEDLPSAAHGGRPCDDEERDVARAKNTERSEARRRYRAAVAATETFGGVDAVAADLPEAAVPRDARPKSTTAKAPSTPVQRPGIIQAFRMAAAPADIRGDLAAFPAIATKSRAVWVPGLLVIGGGIVLLVPTLRDNQLGVLAAQLLVVPPPLIPAFIAGMLAPRAAWLCGLVVGLFAGVIFAVYVLTSSGGTGVTEITPELRNQALLYAVTISPLFGLGTGAFAGFYRRFLRVAGPSQQVQGKSSGKSGKSGKK